VAPCSATEGWKTRFSAIILEDVTMQNLETLKAMRRNKLIITGGDVSIGFFLFLSVSPSLSLHPSLSHSPGPPFAPQYVVDNETFESIQMQQRLGLDNP